MRRYKYKIQVRVVIACCILHNFINHQNTLRCISDDVWLDKQRVQVNISAGDTGIEGDFGANDNQVGYDLRESIKNYLWANR